MWGRDEQSPSGQECNASSSWWPENGPKTGCARENPPAGGGRLRRAGGVRSGPVARCGRPVATFYVITPQPPPSGGVYGVSTRLIGLPSLVVSIVPTTACCVNLSFRKNS